MVNKTFTETIKVKDGKTVYENNLENTCIKKDGNIIQPFCILKIGNSITLKQGGAITQTGRDDPRLTHIVELLMKPQPEPRKKQTKKTRKTKTTKKNNTKKETRNANSKQ